MLLKYSKNLKIYIHYSRKLIDFSLSTPCMFHSCSFTYIPTQLPTQFYPDSLHPHSISRILTLIFCNLHILPLIPHIPNPHVALFPVPIPLISLPDSPFCLLQIATFCYRHKISYSFQKIQIIE